MPCSCCCCCCCCCRLVPAFVLSCKLCCCSTRVQISKRSCVTPPSSIAGLPTKPAPSLMSLLWLWLLLSAHPQEKTVGGAHKPSLSHCCGFAFTLCTPTRENSWGCTQATSMSLLWLWLLLSAHPQERTVGGAHKPCRGCTPSASLQLLSRFLCNHHAMRLPLIYLKSGFTASASFWS
jgi:hypothetical protein